MILTIQCFASSCEVVDGRFHIHGPCWAAERGKPISFVWMADLAPEEVVGEKTVDITFSLSDPFGVVPFKAEAENIPLNPNLKTGHFNYFFHLTINIPNDAKAGPYSMSVLHKNKELARIPLNVD